MPFPHEWFKAARIVSTLVTMSAMGILSCFLMRRVQEIRSWRSTALSVYLVLLTYLGTMGFFIASAILLDDIGLDTGHAECNAGIMICLTGVFCNKSMVYLFTLERSHIVRGARTARYKDRLYILSTVLVFGPGLAFMIWSFADHFSRFDEAGNCIIGARREALVPVVVFDAVMNIYISLLFIHPLRKLYTSSPDVNPAFRRMALRTFCASIISIVASAINLAVLTGLDGEYGWACLLSCHLDVLVTNCCLHWATTNPAESHESEKGLVPLIARPAAKGWAPGAEWQTGGFSRHVPTVMCPDDLPDIAEMSTIGMGTAISHKAGPSVKFTIDMPEEHLENEGPSAITVIKCEKGESKKGSSSTKYQSTLDILVEREQNVVVTERDFKDRFLSR